MNKKITPNAMSASIMNLIYKKNIKAEEIATSNKKKKDYVFILENLDNINESENILIEFLFDKVGKGNLNAENKKIFTTLGLKNYAKGTKTCDNFISSYTKWKNNVLALGKEQKFYISSATPKVIGLILLIVAFFIFNLSINYQTGLLSTYFIIVVALIFFFYTLIVNKKSTRGSLHYDKWKAFKNFLDDFGAFELKELPEIILWERYLVYATVFGLADKVQKVMNVKIEELQLSDLSYDYSSSQVYINLGDTINTSINSAISSAYTRQAANYSNSHSSSSSGRGFGGGFSSGGGFGGGGGGGRGF